MVLSKDGITYCCQQMNLIENYRPENIQACSYDLRMGNQYYYYKKGDHGVKIRTLQEGELLKIPPNAICYVITEESVHMPKDLTASISLSFGLIKRGVMLAAQPPYDPGYEGKTVALLHNLSNAPVKIERGQHILNMVFTKLSIPVKSEQMYEGDYQKLQDLKSYCKEVTKGAVFELNQEFEKERKRFANFLPNILTLITFIIAVLTALITVFSIQGIGGKSEEIPNIADTNVIYPEFVVDEESNTLTVYIDGQAYPIELKSVPAQP